MRARTASTEFHLTTRLVVVTVVLALLSLVACAAPEADESTEAVPVRDTTEENLNAIRAIVASYAEAYNNGDDQAMAELFSEDSVLMPPDSEAIEGKLLIGNRFATIFATFDATVQINVDETRFSGDWAVARGTWALTSTPKSGGETVSTIGKWLNLVERIDGRWKITRNIWNRDAPLDG